MLLNILKIKCDAVFFEKKGFYGKDFTGFSKAKEKSLYSCADMTFWLTIILTLIV